MTSSFWEPLYTVSAPSHPGLRRPTRQEHAVREQASQAGQIRKMTYRGQAYQSSTYVMEGIELRTKALYRGVSHRLSTFSACPTSDRPKRTLYYRGVPYAQ